MRAVQKAGRQHDPKDRTKPGVELREWEKYRWTYHAKGNLSIVNLIYACSFIDSGLWNDMTTSSNRYMAKTYTNIQSIPYALWINKPELTFI